MRASTSTATSVTVERRVPTATVSFDLTAENRWTLLKAAFRWHGKVAMTIENPTVKITEVRA